MVVIFVQSFLLKIVCNLEHDTIVDTRYNEDRRQEIALASMDI